MNILIIPLLIILISFLVVVYGLNLSYDLITTENRTSELSAIMLIGGFIGMIVISPLSMLIISERKK